IQPRSKAGSPFDLVHHNLLAVVSQSEAGWTHGSFRHRSLSTEERERAVALGCPEGSPADPAEGATGHGPPSISDARRRRHVRRGLRMEVRRRDRGGPWEFGGPSDVGPL